MAKKKDNTILWVAGAVGAYLLYQKINGSQVAATAAPLVNSTTPGASTGMLLLPPSTSVNSNIPLADNPVTNAPLVSAVSQSGANGPLIPADTSSAPVAFQPVQDPAAPQLFFPPSNNVPVPVATIPPVADPAYDNIPQLILSSAINPIATDTSDKYYQATPDSPIVVTPAADAVESGTVAPVDINNPVQTVLPVNSASTGIVAKMTNAQKIALMDA